MVAIASLEETKRRLIIEHDDDDAMLTGYIEAASGAVVNYLKGRANEVIASGVESGGELPSGVEVSAPIVTATIMLVGYWYRNPDSDPDGDFEMGYLPKPVMALLYPLRDPALR